jgi:hypothetical protein
LSPPPFPGFNVFVDRAAYFETGGFRSSPNEDMTFSRKFGTRYPTGCVGRNVGSTLYIEDDGVGIPEDERNVDETVTCSPRRSPGLHLE